MIRPDPRGAATACGCRVTEAELADLVRAATRMAHPASGPHRYAADLESAALAAVAEAVATFDCARTGRDTLTPYVVERVRWRVTDQLRRLLGGKANPRHLTDQGEVVPGSRTALRRSAARPVPLDAVAPLLTADDPGFDAVDARVTLDALLAALPADAAATLRTLEQPSSAIAAAAGITQSGVAQRRLRAIRRARLAFEDVR